MSRIIVVDRKGKAVSVKEVQPAELAGRHRDDCFAWMHVDGREEDARAAILAVESLPEFALSALLAQETRPRCSLLAHGALINLRGLALNPDDEGDLLVSIRIWAQKGLVITVSYRGLAALQPVTQAILAGEILDPGDLIAAMATEITTELDPDIAAMGDCVDDIESALTRENAAEARFRVAAARAKAISYRRFIVPQRQALERLSLADVPWLETEDHIHLQEAADRCARMGEELEAVRERAALAHEQLTDLRAELMNQRTLIVSIVALVFLPLTFLTGLLGMNLHIPFADVPWAFEAVVALSIALGVAVTGWFVAAHWLRQ
jgi:zinc transporter